MDDLGDLISFLSTTSPLVRQQAADILQGLTGSPEGLSQLSSRTDSLLPPLLRLVGADAPLSRAALVSLVNLSQEPPVQRHLLSLNAPARCMDYLREGSCAHPQLLVMLLANQTAAEEGAAALLQLDKGPARGLHVATLLQRFLAPVAPGEADTYEHVAAVLPNVTRLQAGRQLLLEPGRGTLRALASQLRSPSALRRRGCAGALKNCCFSCERDGTVEAVLSEGEALRSMLSVLGGAEQAEPDAEARQALAEAIACLAQIPAGRAALWDAGAVELLRKGYEFEEHPGVCAAMETAAALFIADGFQPGGADGGEGAAGAAEGEHGAEAPGHAPGDEARWQVGGKMRPPGLAQGRVGHIEELP